jgi:hypothetical protein
MPQSGGFHMNSDERDVFLSHASEDKDKFVRPFAEELNRRGVTYWLDEAEIKWGDKITQKINDGLRRSRFVVVFLSSSFVGKNWPESELGAALNKENTEGQIVVLPLMLDDTSAILTRYPLLHDKVYLKWSMSLSEIVDRLIAVINGKSIPPTAGALFAAWENKLENEGKSHKEIADFLDTVAEEAVAISNKVSEIAGAAHRSEEVDLSEIFMLSQKCSALTAFRRDSPSVIGNNKALSNILVARLATFDLFPANLRRIYWQILMGDKDKYVYQPPDFTKILQAVVRLNEEAGELRALATIYRARGITPKS